MSIDKIKIEAKTRELVEHFDSQAKLVINDQGEGLYINIETELSGLMIGRRGDTLEALQHVLRLILAKELEEFAPIILDVSGYRLGREEEIKETAKAVAEKVRNFGGTESLPPMNAYERRLAHLVLKEIDGVEGFSEGEEPYRRIVVRPKKG